MVEARGWHNYCGEQPVGVAVEGPDSRARQLVNRT